MRSLILPAAFRFTLGHDRGSGLIAVDSESGGFEIIEQLGLDEHELASCIRLLETLEKDAPRVAGFSTIIPADEPLGRYVCTYLGTDDISGWIVLRAPQDVEEEPTEERLKSAAAMLSQMLAMQVRLRKTRLDIMLAGLSVTSPCSVIVDQECRVLAATRAARAAPDWRITGGRLRMNSAEMKAQLESAVTAVGKCDLANRPCSRALRLPVGEKAAPRAVVVRTLPKTIGARDVRPDLAGLSWVSVGERGRLDVPSRDEIASAFGLTPKEAELVHALMSGDTVAERAKRRRVSEDAERVHLRSIYNKVRCKGQVELLLTVSAVLGYRLPAETC